MHAKLTNTNLVAERIYRRPLFWTALLFILAGVSGAVSVLGKGDAVFILNHRLRLETSVACLVVGAIAVFKSCFQRTISLRPALVGGLVAGMFLSLALVFKDGWPFLFLLPLGGLAAGRALIKGSAQAVTRRQGGTVGSKAGLVASLVGFGVGLPAALVTQQIIENNFLKWAAKNIADVPVAAEPGGFVGACVVAWLVLSIFSVGLGWLTGTVAAGLFEKR